jgi:CRISPR-associated exonuclease Cas4
MRVSENWLFDVTDIKQYACCPRLVYYHTCLPDVRPLTYTMQEGIQSHQQEETREDRRSLHHYGLERGERLFHYALASEKWGLKGQVDMVIVSPTLDAREKTIFPVEYKNSEQKTGLHFQLQLAAYALLLEEAFGMPVPRAFLYSIPRRQAEAIEITLALRKKVTLILQQMRSMLFSEEMPAPTKAYRRCPTCEFRRFCNDVV